MNQDLLQDYITLIHLLHDEGVYYSLDDNYPHFISGETRDAAIKFFNMLPFDTALCLICTYEDEECRGGLSVRWDLQNETTFILIIDWMLYYGKDIENNPKYGDEIPFNKDATYIPLEVLSIIPREK